MARARGKARQDAPQSTLAPPIPIDPTKRSMVKGTKEMVAQRVHAVLALRVKGAGLDDVMAYAQANDPSTGRPWNITRRQLQAYCEKADKIMLRYREEKKELLLGRHLAMRDDMYKSCRERGADETALAVLKDSARLQGLYPDEKGAGTGAPPVTPNVNILVDLRGLAPGDREQAIRGGAIVDPAQLADLSPDELVRLHTAARQQLVTVVPSKSQ